MSTSVDGVILDALRAATARAREADEIPIAACVVVDGQIIAIAHNETVARADPSAHAEILALRAAGQVLSNHRLVDATLYATVEPCAMCAGAIQHARVAKLVFGMRDPKFGACGSVLDLFAVSALNHHMDDMQCDPMLADIAQPAMRSFFEQKRARPKQPAFAVVAAQWASESDREALLKIRFDVFVHEQRCPANLEVDDEDPRSEHVIARLKKDGQAIATGRLLPNGNIGRMAVVKGYRRTGAGFAVLQHLITRAAARGFLTIELSAQTHALGFYERAGFVAYGPTYLDCDIEHQMMRCTLANR